MNFANNIIEFKDGKLDIRTKSVGY